MVRWLKKRRDLRCCNDSCKSPLFQTDNLTALKTSLFLSSSKDSYYGSLKEEKLLEGLNVFDVTSISLH